MSIPILTYHAMRIHGDGYADNDLAALASDLQTISECGWRVRPLPEIVADWLRAPGQLAADVVALTCDDGADFDAVDLPHPSWGVQRSVLGILSDFARQHPGRQPGLNITSFVIVSPEARVELDRTCMVGRGWWNESWWESALASGLMAIGNHSWDHNHDTLARPCEGMVQAGTFTSIDFAAAADFEIAQADRYLKARASNPGDRLFAYPYGETNAYLVDEYLPAYSGFDAAFTTDPEYLAENSSRWRIPRFMCGRDWKSPDELAAILRKARSS